MVVSFSFALCYHAWFLIYFSTSSFIPGLQTFTLQFCIHISYFVIAFHFSTMQNLTDLRIPCKQNVHHIFPTHSTQFWEYCTDMPTVYSKPVQAAFSRSLMGKRLKSSWSTMQIPRAIIESAIITTKTNFVFDCTFTITLFVVLLFHVSEIVRWLFLVYEMHYFQHQFLDCIHLKKYFQQA